MNKQTFEVKARQLPLHTAYQIATAPRNAYTSRKTEDSSQTSTPLFPCRCYDDAVRFAATAKPPRQQRKSRYGSGSRPTVMVALAVHDAFFDTPSMTRQPL